MRSDAETVEEYLAEQPADRRESLQAIRQLIVDNLPDGYVECMQYGMISYVVPLSRTGETYNGQPLAYVSLGSQKNTISLYLMSIYGHEETFRAKYAAATGKKPDMGRSCVRFRRPDDLPLELIAETIASTSVDEFVDTYLASRPQAQRTKPARTTGR